MKNKLKTNPFTAALSMAGTTATLDITGTIGWDTEAIQFTDLVAKAKEAGCTQLTVRINSLGGYCYDGLAMGDALRNCGMHTVGVVMGTAQSMASYILQCCTEREAHAAATIMFHQPTAGVCGTVDEILTQAQYLCGLRDKMFEDMAARCGTTGPALSAEHQTMKIYTAEQALEKGFIDRVTGSPSPAPAEQDPTPAEPPAQTGGRVYEFDRVQMALAMAAATETDTEKDPETDPEEQETTPEKETEPAAPEKVDPEKKPEKETDPETETEKETETETAQYMTREQVEQLLAEREARMLAEISVPAAALPGRAAAATAPVVNYTMAELDSMPAMQRLDVLRANPALAAAYANH